VSGQQGPLDVYRVVEDAKVLRERLDRLLWALVLTAETVAEAVEEDVLAHSQWAGEYEYLAKTSREDASLYREFLHRLHAASH
jgi:hypothetical protein